MQLNSIKNNPFFEAKGSSVLNLPVPFLLMLLAMPVVGAFVVKTGIVGGALILVLIVGLGYLTSVFISPRVGLISLYFTNYFLLGTARYIGDFPIPIGMFIDFQLVLVLVALFFKSFFVKVEWKKAKGDLFILCVIWFAWILFQFVNPFAIARVAWFYEMRNVGLYLILTVPLVLIVFDKYKDLEVFLKMWAIFSILGALKGIMQKQIGLDPFEDAWVHGPDRVTHILHGKIRYFSFFSDAGQYGASMGHSGLVFGILAAGQRKSKKWRIIYGIVSVLSLYGMMISGTRGAIFVPIMGVALYVVIIRNFKIMILGALLGLGVLVFFKFTMIGQGNYTIARMRTAFNPSQDASMQVRLNNQRYLRGVMRSYPIGGGIGSTGKIAEKVAPGHPIAETPPDSWFVQVWMEQGIVGLMLHLFVLLYIVAKGSWIIMFKLKDPWVKTQLTALVTGMFGILVASYGNGVLGQKPTVIIIYSTMAFLFLGERYEKEIEQKEKTKSIEK